MKFKLTATQLIVISVILFLTTNIFIWTSVTRRISIYTQNVVELEYERADNRLVQAESGLIALYNISKKNVLYFATLIKFDMANNDATSFTSKRLAEFLDCLLYTSDAADDLL